MAKKRRSISANCQHYADYKNTSKRRKIKFSLTLKEFLYLTCHPCFYCGQPPKNFRRGFVYNGIDRIDHDKGYTVKNSLPCCSVCNSIRGKHLTVDEMRAAMCTVLRLRKQSDPK